MKILFDHQTPFTLAHGGFQTQIEQTKAALEALGVHVEYVRWWDDSQRGDLIHFFGRPGGSYVEFAHQKDMKVVIAELLGGLAARPAPLRWFQRALMVGSRAVLPRAFTARLAWDSYQLADACVALTPWEAELMQRMFDAPPGRLHVIPNGVEREFLDSAPATRGEWLVCTATITERKRVLELAEAAVRARTPLWILGKPYSETDPYAVRFLETARAHPDFVRYEGSVSGRARLAKIYREARGFVLLSTMESLSLSALEAAACGCPLLLSDLPWARTTFGTDARYCSASAGTAQTSGVLRAFYDQAPQLKPPPRPKSWLDVAAMFKTLYERVLKTSR